MNPDAAGAAPVTVTTLGSPGGLRIAVADRGARWLSCRVPLPDGSEREVLLGTPDPAADEPGYLGAVVGRYANRLRNASFTLDGVVHTLARNEGPHQLHGGPDGFDRRMWRIVERSELHLRLALHSPDGDQGYPGAVDAEVTYRVDPQAASVHIAFEATAGAPCPVSLASHAYYNLDGDDGVATTGVLTQRLRIAAGHFLPVDEAMIPLGVLEPVDGTPFDLRRLHPVGADLGQGAQQALAGGYDHCYALDDAAARGAEPAVEMVSTDGRVAMRLHTDYPGLQVYSGNHLAKTRDRHGHPHARHAGLALEPQFFPNAPNQPGWAGQGCILRPGRRLARWMQVRFDVR